MHYDVNKSSLLNTSEFSEVPKIYALDFSSWKRSALCQ